MGLKRTAGLVKRGNTWHIDKKIEGKRVCKSTGETELVKAQKLLSKLQEETRQTVIYGIRRSILFDEAAAKFVLTNQHKRSLKDDISRLKGILPWIGDLHIDKINMDTLEPWLQHRLYSDKVKNSTINHGLKVIGRILTLASTEWRENGKTWLKYPAKMKLLSTKDALDPYPLTWTEQNRLFSELAPHLRVMGEFAVNTGCRDQEICNLRWEWEVRMESINASFFIIPKELVKNGDQRLVILNKVAQRIIGYQRGCHPEFVFTYRSNKITRMTNSGWNNAKKRSGVLESREHDLKHTYGARLRAADVSFEDRQDLLGHKSGRITTHYSAANLLKLIEASNKVCGKEAREKTEFLRIAPRKS